MPPWDRFRELCLLHFGPPIRGSRLAELGRLSFTSTVQDFADRFQALACHARVSRGNIARSSSLADSRITYGWTWNSRPTTTCRQRCTTLGHMSAVPRRCSCLPRVAGPDQQPTPRRPQRRPRGHHRPLQLRRHVPSGASHRRINWSAVASACASTATSPTHQVTSARASSTWRQ
jgi:hypothetical protein